jgi:hypothetical protein
MRHSGSPLRRDVLLARISDFRSPNAPMLHLHEPGATEIVTATVQAAEPLYDGPAAAWIERNRVGSGASHRHNSRIVLRLVRNGRNQDSCSRRCSGQRWTRET